MTHPGSLIRWGALGAVVLLVRAIVRESRALRSPVILLPPAPERGARARAGRAQAVDLEAAATESDPARAAAESGPASEAARTGPASGAAESGPASGRATEHSKPARE